MQPDLTSELLELVRLVSTSLPPDVERTLRACMGEEESGSAARGALETVLRNVEMARQNSTPICQDTGTPIFYVQIPQNWSRRQFREQIEAAVVQATEKTYLRPNSVNAVTGKNTGDNTGDEHYPTVHFEEIDPSEPLVVDLILKGGGCENVGAQYKLPNSRLGAGRDLEGVRKVVLDVVNQAQGKGCAPGALGIAIGGDRGSSYLTWPPKKRFSASLMIPILIPFWPSWKNTLPRTPINWASARWGLAARRRYWVPKSKGYTACPPAILYLSPTCAGPTAAEKWFGTAKKLAISRFRSGS